MKSHILRGWRLLLGIGVMALCLVSDVGAVTVTLEASQDNTLYENDNGTLSNGAGQYWFAGRNGFMGGGIILRGLIQFDVADLIPPGSTITSVELSLHASSPELHTGTVTLHRVLSPWGEGTSMAPMGEGGGGASTEGDATWIHTHFDTELWETPGGDFVPDPSVSYPLTANGPQAIGTTAEMVADVQAWLDNPASNNGWLMRQTDEPTSSAIRFDSRQHSNLAVRPSLKVEFTLPPLLISPQSGLFAMTHETDIVLLVNIPEPERTIVSKTIILDGVDVSGSFEPCFNGTPGTVTEGGQTFRCGDLSADTIGAGTHTFEVFLELSDGTSVQQAVTWVIVENTEP